MTTPLDGKRIVVTRPIEQSAPFIDRLKELGAEPMLLPTIQVQPPPAWEEIDGELRSLERYDWLIFTSVNGVRFFFERLQALQVPLTTLDACKLAAIGPATAQQVEEFFRSPDVIPDRFVSTEIVPLLGDIAHKRILLPRANIARKELLVTLSEAGAEVTHLSIYRVSEDPSPDHISKVRSLENPPDLITFTSSSTVRGMEALLHAAGKPEWLEQIPLACIGPITAATVSELGLKAACVAPTHTTEGLIEEILKLKQIH